MLLSDILSKIHHAGCANFEETDITDVECHSKKCTAKSIFVCINGRKDKGEAYIDEARRNGTRVFVVEESSKVDFLKNETVIFSKNARKTLAEISKSLYLLKTCDLTFVGISGTKGKTTTAVCLAKILEESGVQTLQIGTFGISFY